MLTLGFLFLLACIALTFAVERGMDLPDDRMPEIAGILGLVFVGIGIGTRVWGWLSTTARSMTPGRCARCGKAIPKGSAYCTEHMMEAKDEYLEKQREEKGDRYY